MMMYHGIAQPFQQEDRRKIIILGDKMAQLNGDKLKAVEVAGPGGTFYIAFADVRMDGDRRYFYKDNRAAFFFSASLSTFPKKHWLVAYATGGPGVGGPFKTTPGNEAIFKENIKFFFKTRNPTEPEHAGDSSFGEFDVLFTWKIAS